MPTLARLHSGYIAAQAVFLYRGGAKFTQSRYYQILSGVLIVCCWVDSGGFRSSSCCDVFRHSRLGPWCSLENESALRYRNNKPRRQLRNYNFLL
jgi:hypothetical protein